MLSRDGKRRAPDIGTPLPRRPLRKTCRRVGPMPLDCTLEPPVVAEAAGLTYVNDGDPGISRVKAGDGFAYKDDGGKAVKDAATLDRIARLVIPPAWTDVWICPDPDGHIQATGRDQRGRKQYRYHERWRARR